MLGSVVSMVGELINTHTTGVPTDVHPFIQEHVAVCRRQYPLPTPVQEHVD